MRWKQRSEVTFVTSCWEQDWKHLLLTPSYLATDQIQNQCYPFTRKILVINNVKDLEAVKAAAETKIQEGVLTEYKVADASVLARFGLTARDFENDWQRYNAIAPLTAIDASSTDYLLYLTGDVFLPKPVRWMEKAIAAFERKASFKVANLIWNEAYLEVKKEAYRRTWNFFVAREGFSDQFFFVRTKEFQAPIFGEIRSDSHHYPRGDVFEKRVFSYMKNRQWERITYRHGSYTHQNI